MENRDNANDGSYRRRKRKRPAILGKSNSSEEIVSIVFKGYFEVIFRK